MTDRPLEDIQDEILNRLHAGEPVDRDALLAEHAEHAAALKRFFALVDVIETPPDADAATPSRLGEFEILREIGRGGMGVVYEARQASLNRRVALKVLPPSLRRDMRLLTRFQREAEAAGRLRHPNIVPVYSIGESAGAPFFAMELVDGRSLADVIRARRDGGSAGLPTEPGEWRAWSVSMAARIADALDYAHGRGILHRDIKPGNILLEADGTPRLTDFGLALDMQASELTLSGEVFGSPLYMSPEQAFRSDRPVDARTDIYSLAVTLYELLTLRLPYHGTTQAELMSALSTGRIVDPRTADPDMPEPLARVLAQALRSDPRERYGSAAAFASDLRAALEHPSDVRATHAGERSSAAGTAAGTAGAAAAGAGGLEALDPLATRPEGFHGLYVDLSSKRVGRVLGVVLILAGLGVLLYGESPRLPLAVMLAAAGVAIWGLESLSVRQAGTDERSFRDRHPTLGHPLVGCGCLLLAVMIFFGLGSAFFLAGSHSGPDRVTPPGRDGERSVRSVPPTEAQLVALADGTLPDGQVVLADWLQPDFEVRGVVARKDPGQCRFGLAFTIPEVAADNLVLDWDCSLRVDGAVVDVPDGAGGIDLQSGDSGGTTYLRSFPLETVLGESLLNDAIGIRPVIQMRLGRRGAGGITYVAEADTTYAWTGPERTLFVYDEYPDDFPTLVSAPETDALMSSLLTPRHVRYDRGTGAPGARNLRMTLSFEPAPRGPVPSAMEVLLAPVDGGETLGRAEFTNTARATVPDHETGTSTLDFELSEPPSDAEQRILLALEAGSLKEVRLVMRPSRDLALAEPAFDSYWGGSLDLRVPVWPHVSEGDDVEDGSSGSTSTGQDEPAIEIDTSTPVPSANELAWLADGRHPDGSAGLAGWLRPGFTIRSLVARDDPGICEFSMLLEGVRGSDPDVWLAMRAELLVNGEARDVVPVPRRMPSERPGIDMSRRWVPRPVVIGPDTGPVPATMRILRGSLPDLLSDDLLADRVVVQPRLHVAVCRGERPAPSRELDPGLFEAAGTTWTWEGPETTLDVRASHPADYPRVENDPEIDARMRAVLTPASVSWSKLSEQDGGTLLRARLAIPNPSAATPGEPWNPVAVACVVELYRPGADVRFAWGVFDVPAGSYTPDDPERSGVPVFFFVEDGTAEGRPGDPNVPADLHAGTLDRVRVVLRSSREVVLGETLYETYWGGTVEADVPMVRSASR
ncbi:MAG: serine/threonine-protein kinase [Planctomycetota bacterium]|jgi:tRNA A-37 threonylcarbamoyl transferase component Bud32